jgi:hypothetical protein
MFQTFARGPLLARRDWITNCILVGKLDKVDKKTNESLLCDFHALHGSLS